MPNHRLPAVFRILLCVSGWIVPARRRQAWREHWDRAAAHCWVYLLDRFELPLRACPRMFHYCGLALADAVRSRFDQDAVRQKAASVLRSPALCLGVFGAAALAVPILTSGFLGMRTVLKPLPYADPARLVTLRQPANFAGFIGVPIPKVALWCRAAKSADIAAYALHWYSDSNAFARTTPNFFGILGVRAELGRAFEYPNEPMKSPAVLSHWAWTRDFESDPNIVGRRVWLGDEQFTIIGVMPRGFWAISREVTAWTLLSIDPLFFSRSHYLIGAVARLKPGITSSFLVDELREISLKDKNPWVGKGLVAMPIEETTSPWGRVAATAVFLVFEILLGVAGAKLRKVSYHAMARSARGHARRYWSFLGAKVVLLAFVVSGLWLEFTISHVRDTVAVGILGWVFVVIAAPLFCWTITDQARRCPVCLRRLGMPVVMGSWASPLLEPATTEFVCEHGHGTLCVPETGSSAGEDEHWTALDESWRELFK